MGGSASFLSKLVVAPAGAGQDGATEEAKKESWRLVKKQIDQIGTAMFAKLYEEDPATFQMFKSFRDKLDWRDSKGFKAHTRTVMNVICSHVVKAQTEKELASTIKTMGTAHSFFNITQRHFDIMKEALLEQLQIVLKEKFTPAIRTCWATAFDEVAVGILSGMSDISYRHVSEKPEAALVALVDQQVA